MASFRTPYAGGTPFSREVAAQGAALKVAQESLVRLQMMIEDKGWQRLGNRYNDINGLNLDNLQTVSEDIRGWIVAGGLMKRIVELRGLYVYSDGVSFANMGAAEEYILQNENNLAKVFSIDALMEINRAHGSEGSIVFLVNRKTKEVIRLPFDQLREPFIDAEDPERIWYIHRSYKKITVDKPEGEDVEYYVQTPFLPKSEKNKREVRIGRDQTIAVSQDYDAVVWKVNGQVGWTWGIPDLLPVLQWVEKYSGYLKNQDRFAEALAMIAWEYKAANSDDAKKQAAVVAGAPSAIAGSVVHTEGQEAKPLAGASAVSFENGRPLAAQAAAAGEIPVESLLGESQMTAGGKLDPDVMRMATARRASATRFFKSLGRLLGAPANFDVVWPDLESETPFREAQMMIAAWGTGMYEPEEIRDALARKLLIELKPNSKAPDGILIPNNEKSLKATADATAPKEDPTDPEGKANGQGKDKLGVGKTSDGDNTARDKGEV